MGRRKPTSNNGEMLQGTLDPKNGSYELEPARRGVDPTITTSVELRLSRSSKSRPASSGVPTQKFSERWLKGADPIGNSSARWPVPAKNSLSIRLSVL